MKKIQSLYSSFHGLGEKNAALYPMVEEIDQSKSHYQDRKKEIEDLIYILELRIQAEQDYSNRLFTISDRSQSESIKIGLLAKEIECFKANCRSKARAALELAENVSQDCVEPLREMIGLQEPKFKNIVNSFNTDVPQAYELNLKINTMGMQYFKSCQQAEKMISAY